MNSHEFMLDFAFLCLGVESEDEKDPTAKALVTEIILNRVESPAYPDTVFGVITQRAQFSYFNNFPVLKRTWNTLDLLRSGVNPTTSKPVRKIDFTRAIEVVSEKVNIKELTLRENRRVLDKGYLFMYAPKSMKPPGRKPPHWKAIVEEYIHGEWVFGKMQ